MTTRGGRRDWSAIAFAAAVILLAGAVAGVLQAGIASIEPLRVEDPDTGGFTLLPGPDSWWPRFLLGVHPSFEVLVALLLVGVARPTGVRSPWFRALVAAAALSLLLPVVGWIQYERTWSNVGLRDGLLKVLSALAYVLLAVLMLRGLAGASARGDEGQVTVSRTLEES